jgi:hypothetical protein
MNRGNHSPQELMGLGISPDVFDRRQRSRTPRSVPLEPVELPSQRFSWLSVIWNTGNPAEGVEGQVERGRSRGPRLHTCPRVEDLRYEATREYLQ